MPQLRGLGFTGTTRIRQRRGAFALQKIALTPSDAGAAYILTKLSDFKFKFRVLRYASYGKKRCRFYEVLLYSNFMCRRMAFNRENFPFLILTTSNVLIYLIFILFQPVGFNLKSFVFRF